MVVGIDEVGRGCLAGPLVVGVVSLNMPLKGLKDSKKLTPKARFNFSKTIYELADCSSLGWVWPHEIDALGLTKATSLAIHRALSLINKPIEQIIIDGSFNFLREDERSVAIIKADDLIPSVSAASVIAKVARDNYMTYIDQYFPAYGFKQHVGYGTLRHRQAIESRGPCGLHRMSFRPLPKELLSMR